VGTNRGVEKLGDIIGAVEQYFCSPVGTSRGVEKLGDIIGAVE
jgi:hypothetical protein